MNDFLGVYIGFTGVRKKIERGLATKPVEKNLKQRFLKIYYKIFNWLAFIKRLLVSIVSLPIVFILRSLGKEGSTIYLVAGNK